MPRQMLSARGHYANSFSLLATPRVRSVWSLTTASMTCRVETTYADASLRRFGSFLNGCDPDVAQDPLQDD